MGLLTSSPLFLQPCTFSCCSFPLYDMNAEIIQHMERPHMMQQHLADFLQRQVPGATHETVWDDGRLPLYVTSYQSDKLPPLDLITSVRALVFREGDVLVVRDPVNV